MHGEEFQPPTPITWYPNKLAWQLDASRNQLRKVGGPCPSGGPKP